MATPLHDLGVAQLAAKLRAKEVSAVELAQAHLARLDVKTATSVAVGNTAALDRFSAFLAIDPELTLAQARAADARLANGTAGPLEGVPLAHKDIFVTKDLPTTAGSKMLAGYRSPFDATTVARLAAAVVASNGER